MLSNVKMSKYMICLYWLGTFVGARLYFVGLWIMATTTGMVSGSGSYNFKVVLLGEGCVGKTSVVLRYVEDTFNEKHITTLQVSFILGWVSVLNIGVIFCLYSQTDFGAVMSCDRAIWRSNNALHFSSEVLGSNLCRDIWYTDWNFHGFAQFLQANARIVSRLGCDRLFPNPFHFILHKLSNYLTLYRQRYWNLSTINCKVCYGMNLFVV